jgi:hypothetical protein
MPYCPECGTQTESNWLICPKCGSKLQRNIKSNTSPHPIIYNTSHQSENNTYGIEALIFAILGFIMIPVLGSILGIIFGLKGKDRDDNSSFAQVGLILGIIGIFCWLIFGFAFIIFFVNIFTLMGSAY